MQDTQWGGLALPTEIQDLLFRNVDDGCGACYGSCWVAVVRGRFERVRQLLAAAMAFFRLK